jgi:hypothetical protein
MRTSSAIVFEAVGSFSIRRIIQLKRNILHIAETLSMQTIESAYGRFGYLVASYRPASL